MHSLSSGVIGVFQVPSQRGSFRYAPETIETTSDGQPRGACGVKHLGKLMYIQRMPTDGSKPDTAFHLPLVGF
jgi:hypothetical protein